MAGSSSSKKLLPLRFFPHFVTATSLAQTTLPTYHVKCNAMMTEKYTNGSRQLHPAVPRTSLCRVRVLLFTGSNLPQVELRR